MMSRVSGSNLTAIQYLALLELNLDLRVKHLN